MTDEQPVDLADVCARLGVARGAFEVAAIEHIAKLEAALRELTDACIAEFGDGETAPRELDDSSVYAGAPDGHGITFGMLRRARAVLSI